MLISNLRIYLDKVVYLLNKVSSYLQKSTIIKFLVLILTVLNPQPCQNILKIVQIV